MEDPANQRPQIDYNTLMLLKDNATKDVKDLYLCDKESLVKDISNMMMYYI